MATTQRFSITLPQEMADIVECKIRSGAYSSASEVMHDGMRALIERDTEIEHWLREEVVPGHEEFLADPTTAIPADAVLDRIKARRADRQTR